MADDTILRITEDIKVNREDTQASLHSRPGTLDPPYQDPNDPNVWYGYDNPPRAGHKGGRQRYDFNIFGDHVKFWRAETMQMTQQQAAEALSEKLGRPVGITYWRRMYEDMGREQAHGSRREDGTPYNRHGLVTAQKCKEVALALDIPEEEVLFYGSVSAGFVPDHKRLTGEWQMYGLVLSEEEKQEVLALCRKLRAKAAASERPCEDSLEA